SASDTYFARVPIMAAISTSQSSLVEPRGFSTASFGPESEVLALMKKIGSVGVADPGSLAWSGEFRPIATNLGTPVTRAPDRGLPETAGSEAASIAESFFRDAGE